MKRNFLILLCCALGSLPVLSQEKKVLTFNGYVNVMESVLFDSLNGTFTNENLIHNRLNLKGYINGHITFGLELRNRLFTGDLVESGNNYAAYIGSDQGLADLSWNLVNKQSVLLNTTIDRYWLDLNCGKFQARIGRQRINWGQTIVWNPNDLFNTYSFFDVDYIERPGSDAIRLQYYPGSSSSLEFAVKGDLNNNTTAAALYRFNKWGFDIQFLGGYFEGEDWVAGTGWSGSFGSVSFRGEASWFRSVRNFSDSSGTALITTGFDKAFRDNSMVQLQFMYCNEPADFSSFGSFYTGNLSAKELAFSKFTAFGHFTSAVTPLLNLGLSAMWFPDLNGFFAGPSIDVSLAENIDISLIWQYFESRVNGIRSNINLGFLRMKYSF